MKICLLGDTHFGVRNDSKTFHDYYAKFYDEVFFPYLLENGIDTVIQLGDLFDRRKYINFVSLTESRRYFFDKLKAHGIKLHALIGNHDIFYKHTLEVNSPELLLKDYDNITLWREHGKLTLDGLVMDMIPWICNENEDSIVQYMHKSTAPICLGHFELRGFQLSKGVESHEGMECNALENYDHVYSGHFHTRSTNKNITYVGTPYELFWSDYDDPKGFHILDTKTMQVEFVENPLIMFRKIYYDDAGIEEHHFISTIKAAEYERLRDTYIKVVVVNKTNPYLFDRMLDELYKAQPADISIVEDFTDVTEPNSDDEVDQAQDTLTILSNYIDAQTLSIEPMKLKTIMRELYVEALSTENVE